MPTKLSQNKGEKEGGMGSPQPTWRKCPAHRRRGGKIKKGNVCARTTRWVLPGWIPGIPRGNWNKILHKMKSNSTQGAMKKPQEKKSRKETNSVGGLPGEPKSRRMPTRPVSAGRLQETCTRGKKRTKTRRSSAGCWVQKRWHPAKV